MKDGADIEEMEREPSPSAQPEATGSNKGCDERDRAEEAHPVAERD